MHNRPHTDAAKAKMSAATKGKPRPWKHRPTKVVDGVLRYRCGSCEGFFPKEGFHRDSRTLLGIKTQCKGCHNATSVRSRSWLVTSVKYGPGAATRRFSQVSLTAANPSAPAPPAR